MVSVDLSRFSGIILTCACRDVNMAVFLGRPGSVVLSQGLPSQPIDAPEPTDMSKTPIATRDPAVDPPTPLTRQIFLWKVGDCLRYILDLEPDGSHPKDFSKVDHVHQCMVALESEKPAVFRVKNADRTWDSHPACASWIHGTRLYMEQLHYFGLMALHRPYIFHRRESRVEALRAAVNMLGLQRQTFDGLPLVQWRSFQLFFGSFDAVVVIASIFILFPHENPEMRDGAVRRFHWTIAKFEAIREHNSVARAAQGVLKAIQARFIKAVGKETPELSPDPDAASPSQAAAVAEPMPDSTSAATKSGGSNEAANSAGIPSTASSHNLSTGISPSTGSSGTAPWMAAGEGTSSAMNGWSLPDESLSLLAPIYPTSDLFFNDLVAKYDGAGGVDSSTLLQGSGAATGQSMPVDAFGLQCQFDGDFGAENNFWQFMNQFNPDFAS